MKIQYASDLHLEFPENRDFLKQNPLKPKGDILVLAGDIVPFAIMDKHDDFFNYVSDHFEDTYWIPGNHEYYHYDLAEKSGSFHEKIKDNVHLLNNTIINKGEVDLIFSTLWSQISPDKRWAIERGMSDFYVIKYKGHHFSVPYYNQLHNDSLAFLQQALNDKANKSVVVSHHLPTFMNYPEKYKTSPLNEGFAVELFDLIESNGPDAWIYGHTHGNTPTFEIGKTQLLTNQMGYVKHNENDDFNDANIIIV
jgi:3',5'-cyclic AMP phosphodiesterase CpdA